MKPSVSFLALGAVLGLVLGFLLQTVVRGSGPAPLPPVVTPEREANDRGLAQVRASLDELARRIESLEATVRGQRRPESPADEPDDGTAEILAAVRELQRSVDSKLATVGGVAADLETLREKYPETNWEAVHAILTKWSVDEEGARKETQLLSTREVLERFGPPTSMWSDQAGIHWVYGEGYDAVEDAYQTEMYLRMQDGYVTLLGVKN